MSTSVDTKIVELKFNNDNFADKVDSTLTKLQQLNKDIKDVGLKDALHNWNNSVKKFDMTPVTKGVEEATKVFSKLEVAGITAVANIANTAVNFGKKIVSNLINPLKQGIIQGGLSRAKNIEQATFSFEGQKIGKSAGHEGLSYYHEVMEAVLGTSYSYDVAAKAASQLAASNVGVIETERKLADGSTITSKVLNTGMTDALLGIAGVAAMTGSNFDDISQIFTRVAGQGRVMANDLNSIASRGLNASATLATYINGVNSGAIKTSESLKQAVQEITTSTDVGEDEIRDFVKHSLISFDIFSDAMTKAFGQHAKDSTLTFQGALDDVNAALARIGADFYKHYLNDARDILNSLTPLVDVFHDKIQTTLDDSTSLMNTASKTLSQYLDMLSYAWQMYPEMNKKDAIPWIKEHMNAWTNIADLYNNGNIIKAVEGLQKASLSFRDMEGKPGIDAYQMLGDYLNIGTNLDLLLTYKDELGKTEKEIAKIAKTGEIAGEDLKIVIDGMLSKGEIGFNTFYKAFHKLWSESEDLMGLEHINEDMNKYIRKCIKAGGESEKFNEHLRKFKYVLDTIVSVVQSYVIPLAKSGFTILSGFAEIIVTIAGHLKPLANMLLEAADRTAKFVVEMADFIATSQTFSDIIDGLVGMTKKFFELVNVTKIAEYALYGLGAVFQIIWMAIEKIQNGIAFVIGKLNDAFTFIVDRLKEIISSSEELNKVIEAFKNAGIVVFLINLVDVLAKPAVLFAELVASIRNVTKSIGSVFDKIGEVLSGVAGLFGKIGKVLDELTDALKRMQQLIVATAILEIAFAIAVLAAAIYALSKVDAAKAAASTGDIITMLTTIAIVLAKLSGIGGLQIGIFSLNKGSELTTVAKSFVYMAAAIGIIALALYKIGQLDQNALIRATGAIEVLMITMALIAKFLSGETTTYKSKGLKSLWSGESFKTTQSMTKGLLGLVAMAEAIKIVSKALVDVASISSPEAMYQALGVIEALMISMAIITKWLSNEKAMTMSKGLGSLLAMAVAIRLLAKPILELAGMASANEDALWNGVAAVAAVMAIMSLLLKALSGSEGLIQASVAMVIMAASIRVLAEVVQMFTSLDPNAMWHSVAAIAVMLGAMALALDLIDADDVLFKAAAIIIMAKSLDILTAAVMKLGEDEDKTTMGIASLVVMLGVLWAACWAFEKLSYGGILKLFSVLVKGVLVVAAFGVAIAVLGVGIGVLGVGLMIMATACAALTPVLGTFIGIVVAIAVAIGVLSSVGLGAVLVITVLSVAFLALGAGMMLIGIGLSETASAIKLLMDIKDDLTDTVSKLVEFIDALKLVKDDAKEIGEGFKAISDPLESIKASAETITEQMEKLIGAYSELTATSAESITALADSLTTISSFNSESFTSASDAVKAFIESLGDISTDAFIVASEAENIKNSLMDLKLSFDFVKESITDFKRRTVKTFENIGKSLASIADPIKTLNDLDANLGKLADDILKFVDDLSGMQDSATIVDESATAIANSLSQVGEAAQAARDGFKGFTATTANILDKMGKALNNMASGFTRIIYQKDKLDGAAKAVKRFYNKLSSLSDTAREIASGTKEVTKELEKLGKAAEETAALSEEGMTKSGEKMVQGLITGIGNKKGEVKSKTGEITDAAINNVRNHYNTWHSVGAYLVSGLIAGINSKKQDLINACNAIGKIAEDALQQAAEENSPSKSWMRIGNYMGEGLSIGIKKSGDQVVSASEGLAYASEMAIGSAIQSISDAINEDMDTNPVITPVVDLDNVRSGAALANSIFSSNLMGVRGNSIAASINHVIQNGSKSDIEASIDDLADRIGAMTDTMNSRSLNNYINIDGSTDPEAFADGLIRSFRLNARMT